MKCELFLIVNTLSEMVKIRRTIELLFLPAVDMMIRDPILGERYISCLIWNIKENVLECDLGDDTFGHRLAKDDMEKLISEGWEVEKL